MRQSKSALHVGRWQGLSPADNLRLAERGEQLQLPWIGGRIVITNLEVPAVAFPVEPWKVGASLSPSPTLSMSRATKLQISVLMFVHAFALGAYIVPLPNVLKACGLEAWISFPYIISACAAFISPLIFGSLADRKFAPERLLAVVAFGSAILLGIISFVLENNLGPAAYLTATTCYALWAAPGFGLLTAIGLKSVDDPQREFAPLRIWATIGFAIAPLLISLLLHADRSPLSCRIGAGFFLLESIYLLGFPANKPIAAAPKLLRDYFGWDAIKLLRGTGSPHDFLTTALFSMPLAAFYPYVGKNLDALNASNPGAIMSHRPSHRDHRHVGSGIAHDTLPVEMAHRCRLGLRLPALPAVYP